MGGIIGMHILLVFVSFEAQLGTSFLETQDRH